MTLTHVCPCAQRYTPREGHYVWPHRDPDPHTADVFVRPGTTCATAGGCASANPSRSHSVSR
jgi:hypothetical protein